MKQLPWEKHICTYITRDFRKNEGGSLSGAALYGASSSAAVVSDSRRAKSDWITSIMPTTPPFSDCIPWAGQDTEGLSTHHNLVSQLEMVVNGMGVNKICVCLWLFVFFCVFLSFFDVGFVFFGGCCVFSVCFCGVGLTPKPLTTKSSWGNKA